MDCGGRLLVRRGKSGWLTLAAVIALIGCGEDDSTTDDGAGTGSTGTVETGGDTTAGPGQTDEDSTAGAEMGATDEDTTAGPADSTGDASTGMDGDTDGSDSSGGAAGAVAECFEGVFVNDFTDQAPDYDQFGAVPGSHCKGTDHQDIAGVQRAVFLGDSVTVGTPPWNGDQFYRSHVADALAAQFGLQWDNGFLQDEGTWKGYNVLDGVAGVMRSGDFAACAKWGARNDDLTPTQIPQCFDEAEGDFDLTTLVIMTMGGNDIASLTKDAIDGASMDELWAEAENVIDLKREAMEWLTEPGRFPNGIYIVFGNIYEFTDGTGDVQACDVSGLAGFDQPVPAPDELAEVVVWMQEQYMEIAMSTGTDMIFMFEGFCGHGFNAEDPTAPCYRGPGNATWFDFTCTHPNDIGHLELADMFIQTVME